MTKGDCLKGVRSWLVLSAMVVACLLVFGNGLIMGQTTFSSIVGRVTDPSGGIVPGAQVALRNEGTNVAATTQSNTAGDYVFSNLIPGTYEVSVTAQGFERYVVSHLVLYVNQTVRQDAGLTVGAVTQSVEVTAELPLVQTQTSEVGGVIDSSQIAEMPLNGRTDLYGLLTMVPGVQNSGSNPQIAGNLWSASTRETMDGVTFMEVENQRLAAATPSLESVGQFQVVDSSGRTTQKLHDSREE